MSHSFQKLSSAIISVMLSPLFLLLQYHPHIFTKRPIFLFILYSCVAEIPCPSVPQWRYNIHTYLFNKKILTSIRTNPAPISHVGLSIFHQQQQLARPLYQYTSLLLQQQQFSCKFTFNAKTWKILPHSVGLGTACALLNKFTRRGVRRYTFINLSFLDIKKTVKLSQMWNFKFPAGIFNPTDFFLSGGKPICLKVPELRLPRLISLPWCRSPTIKFYARVRAGANS